MGVDSADCQAARWKNCEQMLLAGWMELKQELGRKLAIASGQPWTNPKGQKPEKQVWSSMGWLRTSGLPLCTVINTCTSKYHSLETFRLPGIRFYQP